MTSVTQNGKSCGPQNTRRLRGVLDEFGELTGVLYTTCTAFDGCRKVMVPKNDNLKKYKGKRSYYKDGVPLMDLKLGDMYIKFDSKHNLNCKL